MKLRDFIIDSLKDYRRKIALIETVQERIKVWEDVLRSGAKMYTNYMPPGIAISYKGSIPISPVEKQVVKREIRMDDLQEWIAEDRSTIYPLILDVKRIEAALKCLTLQEKFIIEHKYFEDMQWRDITRFYNGRFKNDDNAIGIKATQAINDKALKKLENILEPNQEASIFMIN